MNSRIIFFLIQLLFSPVLALTSNASFVDPLLAIVIMVKNEEAVIEQTLQPYADAGIQHMLIFDTGSTDNTLAITEQFFQKNNITYGVIKQEPFVDYATSRNRALLFAEEVFPHAGFFLMPDAEWYITDVLGLLTFCYEHLHETADMYGIRLVTPSNAFFYHHRLIRARAHAHFVYPVHEYTVGHIGGDLPPHICFYFRPTVKGNAKSEQRLQHDIMTLKALYDKDPEHESRAAFYLGQTYAGLQDFEAACTWYQRRVEMRGWDEERYVAQYRVGTTYEALGSWEKALQAYHRSFSMRPTRIEPLIRMATHYWHADELHLCYLYAKRAEALPMPQEDICFVEKDVYDYDRYNLLSIASWYVGDYQGGYDATQKALHVRPHEEHLKYNLSIYKQALGILEQAQEKPIVIVSAGYNNKAYYQKNLQSTCYQNYNNYRVMYIDDASTDGSVELVEAYVNEHKLHDKVSIIKNQKRVGSAANFYNVINCLDDQAIVVIVDADDELAHNDVLSIINTTYSNDQVWMTYGNYRPLVPTAWHNSYQLPDEVITNNSFRSNAVTSHVKTFYAWLFKKIQREDFMYKGDFYPCASDIVIMMPMLEMAGIHSRFISDVLYVWNNQTPTNEIKTDFELVRDVDYAVRAGKPYEPLQALSLNNTTSLGTAFQIASGPTVSSNMPLEEVSSQKEVVDKSNDYFELTSYKEKENTLYDASSGELIRSVSKDAVPEKPIVIISVGYKNANFYQDNLDSTLFQNYTNYRLIYIDANSPDGTFERVKAYVKACGMEHKVTLIKNEIRCGSCENIYNAIQLCNPEEIIVMCEADDQLAHNNVLKKINEVYQDAHVWMTYGDYTERIPTIGHCSYQIPDDVIKSNGFRDYPWVSSHLRTYYAWLAQKIKKEDCMIAGEFYPFVSDLVIMFPMLEMAGVHSRFISDTLYVWNNESPLNEGKVDESGTHHYAQLIRSATRYKPL